MRKIILSGVVGWDITPQYIRNELRYANGDDIELEISSPGGSVFDGIEIFNLIKNYKGKKTAKITGLAASMASYIPLAADKMVIEENAVYMIHNVWSVAVGDHNEMRKNADVLEGLTNLLADAYTRKTKKEKKDVLEMMNNETWLFGNEIIENGFADELTGVTENKIERNIAVMTAQSSFKDMQAKMKTIENEEQEKIVAMFKPAAKYEVKTPDIKSGENISNKGVSMDIEKMKNEYPELFNTILNMGVEKEQKRVKAHITLGKKSGNLDYAMDCISNGRSVLDEDVQAEYLSFGMKKLAIDNSVEENAQPVEPKTVEKTEDEVVTDAVARALAYSKKGGK